MVEFEIDVGSEKAKATKSTSGAIASVGKNILEGFGIGTGMQLITSILKSFKPLTDMISGILKLITVFLSPIGDVIIGLLYPILLVLKPIMIAVNQVMQPFLLQGLQFMREGAQEGNAAKTGAGIATIFAGLAAVLTYLTGELLKLALNLIGSLIAQIIGIFFPSAEAYIMENIIPTVNSIVDTMTAYSLANIAMAVVAMGKAVGSDMTAFMGNFMGMIDNVFAGISDEFREKIREALDIVSSEGLFKGSSFLTTSLITELMKFGSEGSSALGAAFNSMINIVSGDIGVDLILKPGSWSARTVDWFKNTFNNPYIQQTGEKADIYMSAIYGNPYGT